MSGGSGRGMHMWVHVCVFIKVTVDNWELINGWMRLGDVWNKRLSSSKQKYARRVGFLTKIDKNTSAVYNLLSSHLIVDIFPCQ